MSKGEIYSRWTAEKVAGAVSENGVEISIAAAAAWLEDNEAMFQEELEVAGDEILVNLTDSVDWTKYEVKANNQWAEYTALIAALQDEAEKLPAERKCYYGSCAHKKDCKAGGCALMIEAADAVQTLMSEIRGECLFCANLNKEFPEGKNPCTNCRQGNKWIWRGRYPTVERS